MPNEKHQNKRKYHLIYKTTNLINQKIYIGAHSTDVVNDGYIGSGTNIRRAIKKYGTDSFRREILFIFETMEEMLSKEKELINSEFLKRFDVYNIVEGGYGGYNKGTMGMKHLHHPHTGDRCVVHPAAIDKMLLEGWKLGANMSSTSNTVWIHKEQKKKMVPKRSLIEYINDGWKKGLPKSPTKNKIWIFNFEQNKFSLCDKSELAEKLNNGWIKKKWSPVKRGSVTINDGNRNLRIDPDSLNYYLSNGWKRGLITSRWK